MTPDILQLVIVNAPNYIGFAILAYVLIREVQKLREFLYEVIMVVLEDAGYDRQEIRTRLDNGKTK